MPSNNSSVVICLHNNINYNELCAFVHGQNNQENKVLTCIKSSNRPRFLARMQIYLSSIIPVMLVCCYFFF